MAGENVWSENDLWQKQREAEARVRRMREENRRLAQQMEQTVPEEAAHPLPVRRPMEGGRMLPLLLALVVLKEGGPTPLVLALLYLAL